MEQLKFAAILNSDFSSVKEFIKVVDAFIGYEGIDVFSIPFGSDIGIQYLITREKFGSRKVRLLKEKNGVYFFNLSRSSKHGFETSGSFFIIKIEEYSNIYTAITFEKGDFFRNELYPFIDQLYPIFLMTFITHKKLKSLIDNFKEINQFTDIIITRASQRLRFIEEGEHKKIMPMVSWPEMSLEEAFIWIHENNGWFQSLQFEVKRNSVSIAEISLTRQGIINTNRVFSKVFESFILPVSKVIYENNKFFGHRNRIKSDNYSVKPLTINFDEDLFSAVKDNDRFIKSMKGLSAASVSILHGNPYIHLSLADYYDGSVYDLWVLNQNQLFIVPQLKSSVASIKRIINHIFDNFAEGNITDYTGIL